VLSLKSIETATTRRAPLDSSKMVTLSCKEERRRTLLPAKASKPVVSFGRELRFEANLVKSKGKNAVPGPGSYCN